MKHCLICINCKKKYKPSIFLLRCDDCNSVVKVEYDHPPKDKNSMMNSLMKSSFFSLGDGDTPIIHLRNLGEKKLSEHFEKLKNKKINVIVEGNNKGRTDSFAKVSLNKEYPSGQMLNMIVTGKNQFGLTGKVIA